MVLRNSTSCIDVQTSRSRQPVPGFARQLVVGTLGASVRSLTFEDVNVSLALASLLLAPCFSRLHARKYIKDAPIR